MALQLAKPALNQLIAIIQRYQGAAIAAINPDLTPIQEFHKGPKWRTAFPWVTVAYDGTTFEESSEQTRLQHISVTLTLEADNFDTEFAQDKAIDYMRVLDQIVMSMAGPPPSYVDWETALPIQQETVPSGTTVPFNSGSVKEVFIEHESQSLVLKEDSETPVIQVSLHMRFDVEEIL
jgi:hypothetical protein